MLTLQAVSCALINPDYILKTFSKLVERYNFTTVT